MNLRDSRGHGVRPGLIGMGCLTDRGSIGLLVKQRRPVRVEGKGVLLVYEVSKFQKWYTQILTQGNACYDL